MQLLMDCDDHIDLAVLKYCSTPASSAVSSISMFSGHNFVDVATPDTALGRSPPPLIAIDSSRSPSAGNGCITSSDGAAHSDILSANDGADVKAEQRWNKPEPYIMSNQQEPPYVGSSWTPAEKTDAMAPERGTLFDKAISVITRPFFFRSTVDRAVRDTRCKSTHPVINTNGDTARRCTTAAAIPDNFSTVQPVSTSPQKNTKNSSRTSHGTWPKCRVHADGGETVLAMLAAGRLAEMATRDCVRASSVAPQTSDRKMPPLPPQRNDSFKRSATMIKHSPQNSDSTLKNSSRQTTPSPGPGGGQYASQSPSLAAQLLSGCGLQQQQQQPHHKDEQKQPPMHRLQQQLNSGGSGGGPYIVSGTSEYESSPRVGKYSVHLQIGSIPKYAGSMSNQSRTAAAATISPSSYNDLDSNEGVSGNRDMVRHATHRIAIRPTSASSSSSYTHGTDSQDLSSSQQQPSKSLPPYIDVTTVPKKPTSLDVHPIYSPRPIPHCGGQSITPSHPSSRPYNGKVLVAGSNQLPSGDAPLHSSQDYRSVSKTLDKNTGYYTIR